MPPKVVDLTDNVKACMVSPSNADAPSLRKSLREKRKQEVTVLYNTKAVPLKEARDPARQVINNVYHQQCQDFTAKGRAVPIVKVLPEDGGAANPQVPVVARLLAHEYIPHGELPKRNVSKPFCNQASHSCATGAQTIDDDKRDSHTVTAPNPSLDEIYKAAKVVGPKPTADLAPSSKSIAVGANPSEIIKETMKYSSRHVDVAAAPPTKAPPMFKTHRTIETNTVIPFASLEKDAKTLVPKMGKLTLELKQEDVPLTLVPGPRPNTAQRSTAHRPRDTMFIF